MIDFQGFSSPTTTPVPDALFDELLTTLTGAEIKVVLYIIRRTFGFHKTSDAISLAQFVDGITTYDGRVLDTGCGIKHRGNVLRSLKSLEAQNVIIATKGTGHRGKDSVTTYSLNLVSELSQKHPSELSQIQHPVITKAPLRVIKTRVSELSQKHPQETVPTNSNPTNSLTRDTNNTKANAEVFTKAEQCFGMLNKIIADKIGDAIDVYTPEWVSKALERTALANVRNWNYTEKILLDWKVNGLESKRPERSKGNGTAKYTARGIQPGGTQEPSPFAAYREP